MSMSQNS